MWNQLPAPLRETFVTGTGGQSEVAAPEGEVRRRRPDRLCGWRPSGLGCRAGPVPHVYAASEICTGPSATAAAGMQGALDFALHVVAARVSGFGRQLPGLPGEFTDQAVLLAAERAHP